jgi:hypothetical protein
VIFGYFSPKKDKTENEYFTFFAWENRFKAMFNGILLWFKRGFMILKSK